MTDDMLNYYADNFVTLGVHQLFDITFQEFLTQPETYLSMSMSVVKGKRVFS